MPLLLCIFVALTLSFAGVLARGLELPARGEEPIVSPVLVVPPPHHANRSVEWAVIALARPLFARDRRPPSLLVASAVATPPLPRLTGTLIGPFGKRAVMVDSNSDKPITVAESDRVGAWTVEAISAGEVALYGSEGTHKLQVNFKIPDQTVTSVHTSDSTPRVRRHSRK